MYIYLIFCFVLTWVWDSCWTGLFDAASLFFYYSKRNFLEIVFLKIVFFKLPFFLEFWMFKKFYYIYLYFFTFCFLLTWVRGSVWLAYLVLFLSFFYCPKKKKFFRKCFSKNCFFQKLLLFLDLSLSKSLYRYICWTDLFGPVSWFFY